MSDPQGENADNNSGNANGDDDDEAAEEDDGGATAEALLGLVNTTPVATDNPVDEPVTSGSDGLGPDGI